MDPIVFDLDDFCDEHLCLDSLFKLKSVYPDFKATLFTIPEKTSRDLLEQLISLGWLEFAVHGFTHSPNQEMIGMKKEAIIERYRKVDLSLYCKGFRPPGWALSYETIAACNDLGWWIAMHPDERDLSVHCKYGYYAGGEFFPYWHGHTHNVCGNWVDQRLNELLELWPRDQKFFFVSDAVRSCCKVKIDLFGKEVSFRIRPGTCDPNVITDVSASDCYALKPLRQLHPEIKTILDIGGHVGSFSVFAHHLWPDADIRCYEAWKENFEILCENCFPFFKSIFCFNLAVIGWSDKIIKFKLPPVVRDGNSGSGRVSMPSNVSWDSEGEIDASACTFEEILADWGVDKIDLVKFDCEGVELPILESLDKNNLVDCMRFIRGEWHGGNANRDQIKGILSKTHRVECLPSSESYGLFRAELL